MTIPRLRALLISSLLALASGPVHQAQQPGEQFRRTLPGADLPRSEADREFRNWIRLLRAGSASDRFERRIRMLRDGRHFLPQLQDTLRRRNHFDQFQVLLVLMELHAPEIFPELDALACGRLKGESGWAALALGKTGLTEAEASLEKLIKNASRIHRPPAYLAVGRLAGPKGAKILKEALRRTRADQDEVAILLGMGMGGWEECYAEVARYLTSRKDRIRRAATAALALLPSEQSVSDLLQRLGDEDEFVRRLALEGLARRDVGPGLLEPLARYRVHEDKDWSVRQRLVLLLGRIGGAEAEARVLSYSTHRRPDMRAAAVAASLGWRTERMASMVRGRLKDPHREVRRVALLVSVAQAQRSGRKAIVWIMADDSDQIIRQTAVLGEVYVNGAGAATRLPKLLTDDYKKDIRKLASNLFAKLIRDTPSAREYSRARLQKLLDDAGVAASWNLNRSVDTLIQRVLHVENARSRGGAGDAPGGPTAAERRAAGPGRRTPAHFEDLHLHLTEYPYLDVRPWIEMPAILH